MATLGIDPAFAQAGTSSSRHARAASQSDATLDALAARIPDLRDPADPAILTPVRAHYLKKTLIKLQLEKEVAALSQKDALSTFGPPFRASSAASKTDLPFLRYMFRHFVLTFPFLRSAPQNFFADKVQVFLDRFLEKNISGTSDRAEVSKRKRLGGKLEKYVALLLGAAIRVKGGKEDVVRVGEEERERLASAGRRRAAAAAMGSVPLNTFEINVVSVRTVVSKGRLRNRVHEEFLIRTRRSDFEDVYVSRRYGDFARLADTLRVEFPDDDIRPPPPKDRSNTDIADPYQRRQREEGAEASEAASDRPVPPALAPLHIQEQDAVALDERDAPVRPPSAPPGAAHHHARQRTLSQGTQATPLPPAGLDQAAGGASPALRAHGDASLAANTAHVPLPTGPLAREKNRLTLRAYLRSLLAMPAVADSAALRDFLLGEPTALSAAEAEDAAVREGLDHVREEEQRRFADEASRRIGELQRHLSEFKADLIQRDGLTRIFATIKSTPDLHDLPEKYQALLEWGRISLASTIFHIFMGSDTSSDIFSQLKRMHGLMPYFVLRGILRISNPVSMIRGVLDLFLAQPFGQRSLLQRMFSSSLSDDARELSEVCAAVSAKVDDPVLCEKVKSFVYAPPEIQAIYRTDAENEHLDLLTCILRSPEAPALGRTQIQRVVRASRAYEEYKRYRASLADPDLDDEGPQNEDAWLYEDLHVLMRMLTRLRDKEQMIALIFEGVTAELLKDMVTIFYSPLAQVYKAANIADSLSDLQTFVNDLIRTVEASEELSYTDPQRTVQVFIDLVQRHEAKFYNFVHQVHSKGSGLFDGLMHWIELFINFVRGGDGAESANGEHIRRGIGEVDLEVCLPAGGAERKRALDEVDRVVIHAYRLKLLREHKLRRRLADREVEGAAKSLERGEDDDAAFTASVVDNLGVGELFTGEVADVEAEESDDDEEHGEEGRTEGRRNADDWGSDDEEGSPGDAGVWKPPPTTMSASTAATSDKDLPPLPSDANQGEASARQKRRKLKPPTPPELKVIPEMVPLFVEMVRPLLRPARSASNTSGGASPVSATQPGPDSTLPGVGGVPVQRSLSQRGRTDTAARPNVGRRRSGSLGEVERVLPQQRHRMQSADDERPPGAWR